VSSPFVQPSAFIPEITDVKTQPNTEGIYPNQQLNSFALFGLINGDNLSLNSLNFDHNNAHIGNNGQIEISKTAANNCNVNEENISGKRKKRRKTSVKVYKPHDQPNPEDNEQTIMERQVNLQKVQQSNDYFKEFMRLSKQKSQERQTVDLTKEKHDEDLDVDANKGMNDKANSVMSKDSKKRSRKSKRRKESTLEILDLTYQCAECEVSYKLLEDLEDHIKSFHTDPVADSGILDGLVSTADRTGFQCVECDVFFPVVEELDNHVKTHHSDPETDADRVDSPEHHTDKDTNCVSLVKNEVMCLDSDKNGDLAHGASPKMKVESTDDKNKVQGSDKVSEIGTFLCMSCADLFSSQKELDTHTDKHHSECVAKDFLCMLCAELFHSQDKLDAHTRNMHESGSGDQKHRAESEKKRLENEYFLASQRLAVEDKKKKEAAAKLLQEKLNQTILENARIIHKVGLESTSVQNTHRKSLVSIFTHCMCFKVLKRFYHSVLYNNFTVCNHFYNI